MQPGVFVKKKRWYTYFPFVPLVCFTCMCTGLGVWDGYSRRSLAKTQQTLDVLGLDLNTELVWGAGAIGATTALYVILSLCMLGLAAGRMFIMYTADRTGTTRMGGRLITWMTLDAIFVVLWWFVTMWMVLLLLGECLFMAVAWGMTKTVKAAARVAQGALDNTTPVPPSQRLFPPPAPEGAGAYLNATASAASVVTSIVCPATCVDLSGFEFALGNATCFCALQRVQAADAYMEDALGEIKGSVVGAWIIFMASTWILMTAATEFGVTRRERQLLRRAAKMARPAAESARLLDGSSNSGGGIVGLMRMGPKKPKSQTKLNSPATEQVYDHETGELVDIELADASVNSGSVRAGAAAGTPAGADGGSKGKGHGISLKGIKKGFSKVAKGTDWLFESIGSKLKGGG